LDFLGLIFLERREFATTQFERRDGVKSQDLQSNAEIGTDAGDISGESSIGRVDGDGVDPAFCCDFC
jgi:hypothetical protein